MILRLMLCLVLVSIFSGCSEQYTDPQNISKTNPSKETTVSIEALLAQANDLWDEEKFELALKPVNQAIELAGVTPALLEYRCDLLFKLERGVDLLECTMLLEDISEKKTPWLYLKIADAQVFLGEKDKAIYWIDKAIHERQFRKFTVFDADRYDLIRTDPRFKQLLNEIFEDLEIGSPAKDFVLDLVDGNKLSLSSLKGKVVLIDFWATWCPPCIKEMPNLEVLYETFHARGFEIISICVDESETIDRAHRFIANTPPAGKLAFSQRGYEDDVVKLYKVNGLPSTWLIDQMGNLRRVGINGEKLYEEVERLLESG